MTRQSRAQFILAILAVLAIPSASYAGPFGLFKRSSCPKPCIPAELWVAVASGINGANSECYGVSRPQGSAVDAALEAEANARRNGCVFIHHFQLRTVFPTRTRTVLTAPAPTLAPAPIQRESLLLQWVATAWGLDDDGSCHADSDPHGSVGDAISEAIQRAQDDECTVMGTYARPVFVGFPRLESGVPTAMQNVQHASSHAVHNSCCYKVTYKIWCRGGTVIQATEQCGEYGTAYRLAKAVACAKARYCCCKIRRTQVYCSRVANTGSCCRP